MKKLLVFALISISSFAQEKVQDFGENLEKLKYPFPVKEISVKTQDQNLTMAYMDLQPKSPNGKTVLLLHGKISWQCIGNKPQMIWQKPDTA